MMKMKRLRRTTKETDVLQNWMRWTQARWCRLLHFSTPPCSTLKDGVQKRWGGMRFQGMWREWHEMERFTLIFVIVLFLLHFGSLCFIHSLCNCFLSKTWIIIHITGQWVGMSYPACSLASWWAQWVGLLRTSRFKNMPRPSFIWSGWWTNLSDLTYFVTPNTYITIDKQKQR